MIAISGEEGSKRGSTGLGGQRRDDRIGGHFNANAIAGSEEPLVVGFAIGIDATAIQGVLESACFDFSGE